jgi:hypothetical protein
MSLTRKPENEETTDPEVQRDRQRLFSSMVGFVLPNWLGCLLVLFALLSFFAMILGAAALARSRITKPFCTDQCENGLPGYPGKNGTIGTNDTTPGTNATAEVANTTAVPTEDDANVVDVGTPGAALLEFFIPLCNSSVTYYETTDAGGQVATAPVFTNVNIFQITDAGKYFVTWEGSVRLNGTVNNSAFFGEVRMIDQFAGVLEGGLAIRYVGNQSPPPAPYADTKTCIVTALYTTVSVPTFLMVQWRAVGAGSPPNPMMIMQNNSLTAIRMGF